MSEEYSNGYARGYEAGQESMLKLAKQDIPDLIAGALGVSRGTAYDMMREALAEQPAQEEQGDSICKFECPECHTHKGLWKFEFAPKVGDMVRECRCGNQLFYIKPEGHMCANCGTVQDYS